MRHHQRIIELRKAGLKPVCLWLTDLQPYNELSVQYEPTDSPASADLRFVKGLLVKVEGQDADAVRAWVEACIRAEAQRVIWTVFRIVGRGEFREAEILGMGDTQHVFDYEPHH
jgi:hypothetical protein